MKWPILLMPLFLIVGCVLSNDDSNTENYLISIKSAQTEDIDYNENIQSDKKYLHLALPQTCKVKITINKSYVAEIDTTLRAGFYVLGCDKEDLSYLKVPERSVPGGPIIVISLPVRLTVHFSDSDVW